MKKEKNFIHKTVIHPSISFKLCKQVLGKWVTLSKFWFVSSKANKLTFKVLATYYIMKFTCLSSPVKDKTMGKKNTEDLPHCHFL
jgi:hypothetical protein